MEEHDDVEAKCPFFIKSDPTTIVCEGIDDSSRLKLIFCRKDGGGLKVCRDNHRCSYCDTKYKDCPIYKMLEEKYQ